MSRHDDSVSLRQMLDHAREAVVMAQPHTRVDLNSNRMLTLALIQLAQIVGEAANRVSKAEREHHAAIPWEQIIGLRNRLVHGYDSINFDILWEVLTVDLPALIVMLEQIIPPEKA
jgi:uncharacterized protein with HEPN domain